MRLEKLQGSLATRAYCRLRSTFLDPRSEAAWAVIVGVAISTSASDISSSDSNPCFKNLVAAIDIGHTQSSPGTKDVFGRTELEYNHELALIIAKTLREAGIGRAITINQNLDLGSLSERPRKAYCLGADLFISIHHDDVDEQLKESFEIDGRVIKFNDLVEGYTVYFSSHNAYPSLSKLLALSIAEALLTNEVISARPYQHIITDEHRKPMSKVLNVFDFPKLQISLTARIPAILLEAGFLSNRRDVQKLKNPEYQVQIANGIVQGLKAVCSKQPNLAMLNASRKKTPPDKC